MVNSRVLLHPISLLFDIILDVGATDQRLHGVCCLHTTSRTIRDEMKRRLEEWRRAGKAIIRRKTVSFVVNRASILTDP